MNQTFGIKRFLGVSLVALCLIVSSSWADGKHFPEKAYKVSPSIPGQRAILVFRDSTETLIIESGLKGEGLEFGWVIPLPAKPVSFEESSHGLIETLSLNMQPQIHHDLKQEIRLFCLIALFITGGCLVSLLSTGRLALWLVLATMVLMTVLAALSAPVLRTAGVGPVLSRRIVTGLTVSAMGTVGSYDLYVLEPEKTSPLDQWLSENGFLGLSEQDEPIVADYIRRQWCFVAAKLKRRSEGYSRPHPVAMSFPCTKPVYPMRLTSTVGSEVYLELFVIAKGQASHPDLPAEVVDKFRFAPEMWELRSLTDERTPFPGFIGRTYGARIGHPQAQQHLWPDCTISKLCATLTPTQMQDDFYLTFDETGPSRRQYFSRQGARQIGLVVSLGIWSIGLLIVVVLCYLRRRSRMTWLSVARVALLLLVLSGVGYGLTRLVIPGMDVRAESANLAFWARRYDLAGALEIGTVAKEFDYFQGLTADEAEATLEHFLACGAVRNVFTDAPMALTDSPGDLRIREGSRGLLLSTYTPEGLPVELDLADERLRESIAAYDAIGDYRRLLGSARSRPSRHVISERIVKELGHRLDPRLGHMGLLAHLYIERPTDIVQAITENIQAHRRRMASESLDWLRPALEYELGMVGCIAHIAAPLDVTDATAVDTFLAEVEQWYATTPRP